MNFKELSATMTVTQPPFRKNERLDGWMGVVLIHPTFGLHVKGKYWNDKQALLQRLRLRLSVNGLG